MSGCLLERTKYSSYIAFSCFLGSFVYPVVTNWIWSTTGFLSIRNPMAAISPGALDFAGAGPVHVIGGLAGLIG